MIDFIAAEEEYWRQWDRQNWLLKGDANMTFFHAYANGHKRKCATYRLETPLAVVSSPDDTQKHIYEFYIPLMGSEEPKNLTLTANPRGAYFGSGGGKGISILPIIIVFILMQFTIWFTIVTDFFLEK